MVSVHGVYKSYYGEIRWPYDIMIAPAHRRQRKMINAVFSIKHMRSITPLFYSVAHKVGYSRIS